MSCEIKSLFVVWYLKDGSQQASKLNRTEMKSYETHSLQIIEKVFTFRLFPCSSVNDTY